MLYSTMSKDTWGQMPMQWDKVQDMFRHLNSMAWGYQLDMEKRMFATSGAEFRSTLIRWDSNGLTRDRKRSVLVTTDDPKHMESVLLVLISEAQTSQRIGMVRP